MSIIFIATIESISTRSDKTLKVILGTQETTDETAAGLINLRGQLVKVLFSDENIIQETIKAVEEASIVSGRAKTPSQKLRHVLYRLWQQEAASETFDEWYQNKMTSIIEEIKLKLDQ